MSVSMVTFSFRPSASQQRRSAVLGDINSWEDITQAGLIKPNAKRKELSLMAYAYLGDDVNADDVVKRLSEVPEVETESVSVAPNRHLV